jgi:hypothetical protein
MLIVTPKQTNNYRTNKCSCADSFIFDTCSLSEISAITYTHESNNRIVENLVEDADCKTSVCK